MAVYIATGKMEIKIELEDWKCENLIAMNHYNVEEVTAYYPYNINPYGNNYTEDNLKPIKIKIAYPIYEKPTALEKQYPMLEDLEKYKYEKVVSKLFSEMLWRMILDVKIC